MSASAAVAPPAAVRANPSAPFTRRQLAGVAGLVSAGAGLITLAWFAAAGEVDPGDQVAFVSLAVLGALVGLAAVLWAVAAGRRAVDLRMQALLGSAPSSAAVAAPSRRLVAVPDGRFAHRADCLLVKGRTVRAVSPGEAGDRRPCPACRPPLDPPPGDRPTGSGESPGS